MRLGRVGGPWQPKAAVEAAIGAFGKVDACLFLGLLGERQQIPFQGNLHILLINAGQLGGDDEALVGLRHLDGRRESGERSGCRTAEHLIEDPVHLAL